MEGKRSIPHGITSNTTARFPSHPIKRGVRNQSNRFRAGAARKKTKHRTFREKPGLSWAGAK